MIGSVPQAAPGEKGAKAPETSITITPVRKKLQTNQHNNSVAASSMIEIVSNVKRAAGGGNLAMGSPDKHTVAIDGNIVSGTKMKTNSLLGSFKVNELSRRNNLHKNQVATPAISGCGSAASASASASARA